MNLYCIDFPNGKRYVGVESNDGQRKKYHSKGYSHTLVGRAIAKYSWEKCTFRYLIKNASKDTCIYMEQKLIKKWNLQKRECGYNITAGGDGGSLGVVVSQKTREKMKIARASYKMTDTWKKSISRALTGKKRSQSIKDQFSINNGGKLFNVIKDGVVVASYINQSRCAKELGLSSKKINQCLHNKAKSHKGYCFVFRSDCDI